MYKKNAIRNKNTFGYFFASLSVLNNLAKDFLTG
jgi:hypothetical protein